MLRQISVDTLYLILQCYILLVPTDFLIEVKIFLTEIKYTAKPLEPYQIFNS